MLDRGSGLGVVNDDIIQAAITCKSRRQGPATTTAAATAKAIKHKRTGTAGPGEKKTAQNRHHETKNQNYHSGYTWQQQQQEKMRTSTVWTTQPTSKCENPGRYWQTATKTKKHLKNMLSHMGNSCKWLQQLGKVAKSFSQ